jgi:hypothetical protein
MGHWSWILQISRVAYSTPNAAYAFISRRRGFPAAALWSIVREELWTMLMASPMFRSNLELPWSSTVFAGDSSKKAFGIAETEATDGEVREEGRFGLCTGWLMADTERSSTLAEREVWAPKDLRAEKEESSSDDDWPGLLSEEDGEEDDGVTAEQLVTGLSKLQLDGHVTDYEEGRDVMEGPEGCGRQRTLRRSGCSVGPRRRWRGAGTPFRDGS